MSLCNEAVSACIKSFSRIFEVTELSLKRVPTVFPLAVLSIVSLGWSQAKNAEPVPSVQEIVSRYVTAVGGEAALKKITTRSCKGTIEYPDVGLQGTSELEQKAPNLMMLAVKVPVLGDLRRGYDGKTGWAIDPQGALHTMSGSELADTKREAEFYMPLQLTTIYPKMDVTGKQSIEDHEVWEVKAVATDGAQRTFDFDTKTGYLYRIAGDEESADGKKDTTELFFEDYKEFDGVKLSTVHRQTSPVPLVLKFTEIKQNVPIDDAVFAPPKS